MANSQRKVQRTIGMIKSIGNYLTEYDYEIDDEHENITILWDRENEKLCDIMDNECRNEIRHPKKKYLMWLETIKRISKWKEGENLYIITKQNGDGYFNCWWSKDKKDIGYYDIIIEKNGYASYRTFNYYSMDETEDIKHSFFIRVDSYYNDKICKKINKK